MDNPKINIKDSNLVTYSKKDKTFSVFASDIGIKSSWPNYIDLIGKNETREFAFKNQTVNEGDLQMRTYANEEYTLIIFND